MSEQQKIWFVYLTDHHEGPFTPDEVAAMVASGSVNLQTLGWKDGMAEWIAIEAIPELKEAVDNPPPPAAADAGGEGFSLAEMLARQQGGGAAPEAEFTSGADALAAFTGNANPSPAGGTGALGEVPPSFARPDAAAGAGGGAEPAPHEEVWTMRVGGQVSGLYSLHQLRNMATAGEVPPHAMLWHNGWTDFQPLSAVPDLMNAAQEQRFGGNKTMGAGIPTGASAPAGRKPVFAPITAAANVGDDEKTDAAIEAPPAGKGAGLKAMLAKLTDKFGKKQPRAAAAPVAGKTRSGLTQPAGFGKSGGAKAASGGLGSSIKRVAILIACFLLVGGAGFAYLKFFASPIPADLDVIADDLELLKETVKASPAEGGRLYLAPARGTEDAPTDDNAPKFYVGTNLPAGTAVTLAITGQPGSLVNRVSFEKQYSASVQENHLATFERLDDDGKPLPMGEYAVKVTAEGATPLAFDRFLGGKKGAAYQDRLKKYKEKLQGEYDREMQELREVIDTLKQINGDVAKKISEYKAGWTTPASRARIGADWKSFSATATGMLTQLDQKLKARTAAGGATYQPRAFQDVATTLQQLQQLVAGHGKRLEGATPATSLDELEGFVTTGVAGLEQTLAQALVKSPLEVLGTKGAQDGGTSAPPAGEGAGEAAGTAPAPAEPAAVSPPATQE